MYSAVLSAFSSFLNLAAAALAAPVTLPLALTSALVFTSAVPAVSGFAPLTLSSVELAFPGFEVSIEVVPWVVDELPLAEDPGVLSLGLAVTVVAEAGTAENTTATAMAMAATLDNGELRDSFLMMFVF
jgi:hypothetical protein